MLARDRSFVSFAPGTPAPEILRRVAETSRQDVFPVLSSAGTLLGLITSGSLRIVAAEGEHLQMMVAVDAMQPPVTVEINDDLRSAVEVMVTNAMREVPALDSDGKLVGLLDENDVTKAYLAATTPRPDQTPLPSVRRPSG